MAGAEGIQPDPDRIWDLLELEAPNNISELRTILGMFQYLGKFAPRLAMVMEPMSELLRAALLGYGDHTKNRHSGRRRN